LEQSVLQAAVAPGMTPATRETPTMRTATVRRRVLDVDVEEDIVLVFGFGFWFWFWFWFCWLVSSYEDGFVNI
jgi:hypothetical protein